MERFINLGMDTRVAADKVILVCRARQLSKEMLEQAIDVSKGNRRSAVFTLDGRIFLADVSYETLLKRIK